LLIEGPETIDIHDYKLTKTYALKKIKTELSTHQYVKQINTAAWILRQTESKKFRGFLEIFVKDAKKIAYEPSYEQVEVEIDEFFEETLLSVTNELDSFLNNKIMPKKCEDVWFRKVKGTAIATRCKFYCDVSHVCPYVNNSANSVAKNLTGW
jgi:hypothetical protein